MRFPSLNYLSTMIDSVEPIANPDPLFAALKTSISAALANLSSDPLIDVVSSLSRLVAADLLVHAADKLTLAERAELKLSLRREPCCPGCPGWAVFNEGDSRPEIQRCDECFGPECYGYPALKLDDEEAAELPAARDAMHRAVNRVARLWKKSVKKCRQEAEGRTVIDVEVES